MTAAVSGRILLDGFRDSATPHSLFSRTPRRLTIAQAFRAVTEYLPAQAPICFIAHKGGISPDLYPFSTPAQAADQSGVEPTHLCYEILPQFFAVMIHRIKTAETTRKGTGTAMIASQYPFWRTMGVERLCVKAHAMSEGFYRRLGFERALTLPESPHDDGRVLTLMALDLRRHEQARKLTRALARYPASLLQNPR